MIKDHDRSGWIGASDSYKVMSSWKTDSFAKWWAVKLGVSKSSFSTKEMKTGTAYEHKILDACGIDRRDRQIRIRKLRLRVNLDGEDKTTVYEVKTHSKPAFTVSKAYWMQCQVEMFATGKKDCVLIAYHLLPEDYDNWFNSIDPGRITRHPIPYNEQWIKTAYLPRLQVLRDALENGGMPNEHDSVKPRKTEQYEREDSEDGGNEAEGRGATAGA